MYYKHSILHVHPILCMLLIYIPLNPQDELYKGLEWFSNLTVTLRNKEITLLGKFQVLKFICDLIVADNTF